MSRHVAHPLPAQAGFRDDAVSVARLLYRFAARFFPRGAACPATCLALAPGFARNASRNFSVGSVLMTSFFSSQPLLAIVTPYRISARFVVLCESVEITTFTPRSLHILRYTSFKSSRSGYELHSIATPCLAQESRILAMS